VSTGGRLLARSLTGLEWLVADEVAELDAVTDVLTRRRQVEFTFARPPREALRLRTADDLFLVVGEVAPAPANSADVAGLGRRVAALDWPAALGLLGAPAPETASTPSIAPTLDVVAGVEVRRPFNRFAVEASVGEALAAALARRYLARTAAGRAPGEAGLTCRVFVREDDVQVAVRVGDRPLHRRAYKQAVAQGSLHPPLAAALARLAAPPGAIVDGRAIIDPFCGDATIAIEAALLRPGAAVSARDVDPARLANARANAVRAGVSLEVRRADAADLEPGAGYAAIVTNPPWDNLVGFAGRLRRSPERFWSAAVRALAEDGVLCCVVEDSLRAPDRLQRLGLDVALDQATRVNGRLARIVLATPPGRAPPL
jgi:tRNA (guanine6-N2)-methyltransferase